MDLLPVFYIFCSLLIPGVYMQFDFDANDYGEDLRVSSSQPQSFDNYHSISASTPTKISNNDPLKFQNDQRPLIVQPRFNPNIIQQQSKNYPGYIRSQKYQKKTEKEQDQLDSLRQSCQWMTLDEFKNVSLDTMEVTIKDMQENTCYILTIRAYLKKDEFNYFPVNKFKSYHYDKSFYTIPSDGANIRSLKNCSLTSISGDGAAGQLRTIIPFQEEIIISVECGFLVFKFVSQGYYLKLENISFYQNFRDLETHSSNQRFNPQDRGFFRSMPKMSNEHLVFSPKNTSQNLPLLVTPLVSRFVCQNRVALGGFNEVQFVIDKFELTRLLYITSLVPLPASQDNFKNRKGNNEFRYPNRRSEDRNTRDTRLISSGPVSVTRCPDPISPLTALESFMAVKVNEPLMSVSLPNAAYKTNPFSIGGGVLGLYWLNCILIQYFIWFFFGRLVMVYNGLSLNG